MHSAQGTRLKYAFGTHGFGPLLVALLAAACMPEKSREASCENTVDTILVLSHDDRMEQFDRLNLDEKYRWLICSNQFVHPPMLAFTNEFAKLGPTAEAYLRPKLETAEDDLTVRDIVSVFSFMQALGTYDIANDAELMHLLESKVAEMSDPDWKRWGSDELERIRSGEI